MNSCSDSTRALDALGGDAELLGQRLLAVCIVRQELVQRRIDGADRHRPSAHDAEDALEVAALQRQQLGERGAPRAGGVGQDHLAHRLDLALAEEHVLGAAEADALGAEGQRRAALIRLIGVGAHAHPAGLVRPGHELGVELIRRGVFRRQRFVDHDAQDLARLRGDEPAEHLAGGAVDRQLVAGAQHVVASLDPHRAAAVVDLQRLAAGDAHLAHLPGDQRRVAGHAAARREDALRPPPCRECPPATSRCAPG